MARRTPFYDAHVQAGGKLVDFAGWDLSVQFTGIIEEHTAVRTAAGVFDVSHMGEVFITGPKAMECTQKLLTNDVAKLIDGQAAYSGMLYDNGTFVDDVIVYRFNPEKFLVVINGANVAKDVAWMKEHTYGASVEDKSDEYGQLAVQGPKAAGIVQQLTKVDLSKIKWYHHAGEGDVAGVRCIIARTGYTGEDGFELYCPPKDGMKLWDALFDKGRSAGLVPTGLGCRDSLRLEMKYALYGNDIDDQHTPLEAGLGWIVKMDKGVEFHGRPVLEKQKKEGLTRKLVGFTMTDKGIPRHGYPILKDGKQVGVVTSGTMSPSLKIPIGVGYVPTALAPEGSSFEVEIRGKPVGAKVAKTPFYQSKK
ncbi:MAG: glycine cleavage system aminomethyltransferase GcvT [Deltaproteobacteria bacterium]|nr:glycine cleavage system aminomethyltransferase GcvT [Deltaproteobacteria bacterium]